MLSEVTTFTVIILGLSVLSYYLFYTFDFKLGSWLISFIPVSLFYIKKIPKLVSVCLLFLTIFILNSPEIVTMEY